MSSSGIYMTGSFVVYPTRSVFGVCAARTGACDNRHSDRAQREERPRAAGTVAKSPHSNKTRKLKAHSRLEVTLWGNAPTHPSFAPRCRVTSKMVMTIRRCVEKANSSFVVLQSQSSGVMPQTIHFCLNFHNHVLRSILILSVTNSCVSGAIPSSEVSQAESCVSHLFCMSCPLHRHQVLHPDDLQRL